MKSNGTSELSAKDAMTTPAPTATGAPNGKRRRKNSGPTMTCTTPTLGTGGILRTGEFRATVRLELVLKRRADGKVLLSTGEMTVTGEFLPGPDVLGTEANRERALRQMAADAARRVAELLADAF